MRARCAYSPARSTMGDDVSSAALLHCSLYAIAGAFCLRAPPGPLRAVRCSAAAALAPAQCALPAGPCCCPCLYFLQVMTYNGAAIVAMTGKNCVAIAR